MSKHKGAIELIVLVNGKNVSITVKDVDLFEGKQKLYVFYKNCYYDPENGFKPVFLTEENKKTRLYGRPIEEYNNLLPEAQSKFSKMLVFYERKMMEYGKAKTESESEPKKELKSESKSNLGIEEALMKLIEEQIQKSSNDIVSNSKPLIETFIKETYGTLPQIHEIRTPTETKKIKGIVHEKFDTVLNLINADIPVFLTGSAGTGKNVICKQTAEALGLEFYFSNAITQEYKIAGFIDANGKYHQTQFYEAFVNGGLFMLDEMDASIPEVLIMLNAAIANKYFDFPIGRFEAHKDFRVIAAGNTFGTGADIEYTGRYQLDAASLDRFALVRIDYSKTIEMAISQNDIELVDYARAFRKATESVGIKHLVTYRAIERIKKLDGIMETSEAIQISLLKNLGIDDIKILVSEMEKDLDKTNKYLEATKKFTMNTTK